MKNFVKKLFDWINNILGSLRSDLIIHAGVSAIILVLLFNIFALFMTSPIAMFWAIFITFIIGILKECLIDDILKDTSVDIQDLYADIVGIIIGVIASIPAMFH